MFSIGFMLFSLRFFGIKTTTELEKHDISNVKTKNNVCNAVFNEKKLTDFSNFCH